MSWRGVTLIAVRRCGSVRTPRVRRSPDLLGLTEAASNAGACPKTSSERITISPANRTTARPPTSGDARCRRFVESTFRAPRASDLPGGFQKMRYYLLPIAAGCVALFARIPQPLDSSLALIDRLNELVQ